MVELQESAARAKDGLEYAARAGLVARGVIYALVGVLALQIAFGTSDQNADRTGALRAVSEGPAGELLLWLLAVGFAGLTVWRLSEAAFGKSGADGKKATKRLASLGSGLVYGSFFFGTLSFALGDTSTKSGNKQSKTLTAEFMSHSGGRWLVLAAGLGIVAIGATFIVRAFQRKFLENLDLGGLSAHARKAVEVLGLVGTSARGLVVGVVGVFVAYAAISFDPGKATGLDGALHKLAKTPLGPWLLAAVAVGLVVFGLYSWCEARWRKVTPRGV